MADIQRRSGHADMACTFDVDLVVERNGIDIVLMLRSQINDGVTARQRLLQGLGLSHITVLVERRKVLAGPFIHDDQRQIIACTETFRQARSDKTGPPIIATLRLSIICHSAGSHYSRHNIETGR